MRFDHGNEQRPSDDKSLSLHMVRKKIVKWLCKTIFRQVSTKTWQLMWPLRYKWLEFRNECYSCTIVIFTHSWCVRLRWEIHPLHVIYYFTLSSLLLYV